jgi:hypothetical protein
MNLEAIEQMSSRLRALLWKLSPEIVSAAESFAEQVLYLPVSATGRSPEIDPATGAKGFRPRDIHPQWVEVPLLYTLSRWVDGLVPHLRPGASATTGVPGLNAMPPNIAGAKGAAAGGATP